MNTTPRPVIQAVDGKVLLSIASQERASPIVHLTSEEAEGIADRLSQAAAQVRKGK